MITETVKGFSDYTLSEAEKRERIREILVRNFKLYGFIAEETPIVEYEEFIKDGNEQDEVVSDIFKLKDKGMRNLALRYELTFQLKRTANNKKLPYKRYQIGSVFRDEPVSSNRFRQFTQADIDVIGSSIKDEAEVLVLISSILKELGIKAEIEVNSRKLMNSAIKNLGIENVEFVLREIDKLDKQGAMQVKLNLAKFIDKDKIIKLFKLLDKPLTAFKKFSGYEELKQLIEACNEYKIKVKFNPTIIRGLSYYNGNVWEVKTQGMKEKINGGGSYLINNISSTGMSFGIDRLCQLAKLKEDKKKVLVINIQQDKKAIKLLSSLRKAGIPCLQIDKISKGLEYANSYSIPYVVFLGSEEVKLKKFKLRDMKTGKEELLDEKELIEKLKSSGC